MVDVLGKEVCGNDCSVALLRTLLYIGALIEKTRHLEMRGVVGLPWITSCPKVLAWRWWHF